MAKRKPTRTLREMEKELGYGAKTLALPAEVPTRLYSDLSPVIHSDYERMKREYEEYQRIQSSGRGRSIPPNGILNRTVTFTHNQDSVTIKEICKNGFYRFAVDVSYGFGVHLPFLFSEEEVYKTISVAKLQNYLKGGGGRAQLLARLPAEIRERIFKFTIPRNTWAVQGADTLEREVMTGGIGDLSGYCFPLSKRLELLRVSKQIRAEALPLVYRSTTFHLDDMDDLIKLLVAIGETGRNNIESLQFSWESKSDLQYKWETNPKPDDHLLQLPTLHSVKCVQLLKQCKLKFLRLYFDEDLVEQVDSEVFKSDPGIQALRSIRVREAQIWSLGEKPLEQRPLMRWLQTGMEQM